MAGETKVKYTDKQAALQKSMAETSAALGVEKIKIFDFAGNSNNVPPGLSGIHPDNGNNGNHNGNSDPTDTTSTIDPKLTEKFIFFYHPDHLGSSSYISDANGEVSQHLEYFAFGETFIEEHANTSYTPYLFNGKELDDETGLYYYGARYQDPKNGVFLSVDPLSERTMTPYAYCNNNPINMIDPTGMSAEGPGDKFISPEAAAKDFAHNYNDNSIKDKKEYGAIIYKMTDNKENTYYTYTTPNIGGSENGVVPAPDFSSKGEMVASVHTHSNFDKRFLNDEFSPEDMKGAKRVNMDAYVATPKGTLLKYDVKLKKSTAIDNHIPSDPNHPMRMNKNDSSILPKNEPVRGLGKIILDNIIAPLLSGAQAIKN